MNAKLPINNIAGFISYVKGQSQKLPYAGGGGPGSLSNLLMALFLKRAGLEMTSVSYRGTAPAMTGTSGTGHIPTMFVPLSEALPQAQAGNIRMLGVSGGMRAKQAPDVPTIAESGFPGFRGESWNGLRAPRHPRRHRQPDRGRVRARRQGTEIRRASWIRRASTRSDRAPPRPRNSSPPTWRCGPRP